MAHKMHNWKYKSPMRENPQKEVLQPCIKTGNRLTALFYWATNSFGLHFRSRENKCMKSQIYSRSIHYIGSSSNSPWGFQQKIMYKE